ncbi:MAG: GAF domain-containing protein [Chloroflexi bacterium]|nr:GAF domain-containing protein [Chloroflexota bacterium]
MALSRAMLVAALVTIVAVELLSDLVLTSIAPPNRPPVRAGILILAMGIIAMTLHARLARAARAHARAAERERMLRELGAALAAELDLSSLQQLVAQQARELAGADLAFLATPDQSGYKAISVSPRGPNRLLGQRLPIEVGAAGAAGMALKERRPVVVSQERSQSVLTSRRELFLSDKTASAMAVPLLARGGVQGLLGLHADAADAFDASTADLLALFADQASVALENARLFQDVAEIEGHARSARLKDEFLSTVAHELRTPLGPILGYIELLTMRQTSEEQRAIMLTEIATGVQHLNVLIADLLDLGRIEAGRLGLTPIELDLALLLEEARLRWSEQEAKHRFVLAVPDRLLVQADPNRVRQVVDNLLSNAVKYSPKGGRVLISARQATDGSVHVRISDQGIGMTTDELVHLFEKFYRTGAAREAASGTGLGLALTRLVVEAHGGAISAESAGPGQGCAFNFWLPAVAGRTNGTVGAAGSGRFPVTAGVW